MAVLACFDSSCVFCFWHQSCVKSSSSRGGVVIIGSLYFNAGNKYGTTNNGSTPPPAAFETSCGPPAVDHGLSYFVPRNHQQLS